MALDFTEQEQESYMRACLNLGLETHPPVYKPYVGVIVLSRDKKIIGRGKKILISGTELIVHAERNAITNLNGQGYYLFTTLEPCFENGAKHIFSSCSELIVESGIKQVVIGLLDRSPTVSNGSGMQYLMDHGVEVYHCPVFEKEIRDKLMTREFSTNRKSEKQKRRSLEEITETHPQVLVDGIRSYTSEDFVWGLYQGCALNSPLTLPSIEREINSLTRFARLLGFPNVRTLPEFSQEVEDYKITIQQRKATFAEKLLQMNPNPGSSCPRRANKKSRDRKNGERNAKRNGFSRKNTENPYFRLLEELEEKACIAYEVCKRKELATSPQQQILTEMIVLLNRTIGLKQETYKSSVGNRGSNADEKLAAELMLGMLKPENAVCMITGDEQFPRLIRTAMQVLTSDDFLPYNQGFRQALLENPYKIFVRDFETPFLYRQFEGIPKNFEFRPFRIRKVGEEENRRIRETFQNLWRRFSEG